MKKLFIILMLVSGSAQAFELMCGFADEIHQYRREMTSNDKLTFQQPIDGIQGETGRRLFVFESGKWIVTLEFFVDGSEDVRSDVSCIVAKSSETETAELAFMKTYSKLPEKRYKDFGKKASDLKPLEKFRPFKTSSKTTEV